MANGERKTVGQGTATMLVIATAIVAGVGVKTAELVLEPGSGEYRSDIAMDRMQQEINSLRKVIVSHGGSLDVDIPGRFTRAFEQLNLLRGQMEAVRRDMDDFEKKNFRPDPFTGLEAQRLEARVSARMSRLEDKIERVHSPTRTYKRQNGD